MGENTKIEWANDTFNGWVGCTKVSAACTNCYAESWAKRTGQDALWKGERRRTSIQNWNKPLRWNREAEASGEQRRVFCSSLADVFEDHPALPEWRADLFSLIDATPALTWLLLTKRPENVNRLRPAGWARLPRNVWLGTTVEDQERANERIPHLLIPDVAVRFVSMEPLLGPVDLRRWLVCGNCADEVGATAGLGRPVGDETVRACANPRLSWVISGGESGGKARPSNPKWFRSLRDQCALAGVPHLFKQWGEFGPIRPDIVGSNIQARSVPSRVLSDGTVVERHGKAIAGRILDGRTHDGFPEAR